MKNSLNIGLVGYKFMGKAHSHAYKDVSMFFDPKLKPTMKIICGTNKNDVKEAALKYGWENYTTKWQEIVNNPEIDIIDISSPGNTHAPIAIAAAKAGKHIICEKPLALSLQDSRDMLEAVKISGVKHMIGFNYRKVPAIKLAKQLIDDGKLGRIFHFRGVYLQDWIVDPNFPLVWRLQKSLAGNGAIGDLGAHIIDLARYLIGEIDEVCALSETFIKERPLLKSTNNGLSAKAQDSLQMGTVDVDDATMFIGRFESGTLCSIESTRFATGRKNGLVFEINGSLGSIKFDFEDMNRLQFYSSEDPQNTYGFRNILVTEPIHDYMKNWWPSGHIIGYEHTFVHEVADFLDCIYNDTLPSPNFYDGVACQEIIEAVEMSAKQRRWVKLKEVKMETV